MYPEDQLTCFTDTALFAKDYDRYQRIFFSSTADRAVSRYRGWESSIPRQRLKTLTAVISAM